MERRVGVAHAGATITRRNASNAGYGRSAFNWTISFSHDNEEIADWLEAHMKTSSALRWGGLVAFVGGLLGIIYFPFHATAYFATADGAEALNSQPAHSLRLHNT
jgi:hypothetical protein